MPIQEEISQRASPNRCDGRDDDDPEEIQPSITRGEHSTHRKDGNAPKIEGIEDHRSSRNAERSRCAAAASACEPAVRSNAWLGNGHHAATGFVTMFMAESTQTRRM